MIQLNSAESSSATRHIAIDPKIAFGRPVVISAGVSTAAIAERIDAKETIEDLAAVYGVSIWWSPLSPESHD